MRSLRLATVLWASTLAPTAWAQAYCDPEAIALLGGWLAKHPFAAGAASADRLEASTCTPWPDDDRVTIVAAIYRGARDDSKNFALSLVDADAGEVRSAIKGHFATDAFLSIGPDSLRIDTAAYRLAPGVRAFGIDLSSAASPPPCAGWLGPRRTLFVVQGRQLRPVLDSLDMASGTSSRCDSGEPDASTTRTITMGQHAAHGYADLVIAETTKALHAPTRRHRHTMRYDGSAYVAQEPEWYCCSRENSIEVELVDDR